MCTAFVDNSQLGVFYVTAYAIGCTERKIRRIHVIGILENDTLMIFLLFQCRFWWFIFSRAGAVERRTASLFLLYRKFLFLRNHIAVVAMLTFLRSRTKKKIPRETVRF